MIVVHRLHRSKRVLFFAADIYIVYVLVACATDDDDYRSPIVIVIIKYDQFTNDLHTPSYASNSFIFILLLFETSKCVRRTDVGDHYVIFLDKIIIGLLFCVFSVVKNLLILLGCVLFINFRFGFFLLCV